MIAGCLHVPPWPALHRVPRLLVAVPGGAVAVAVRRVRTPDSGDAQAGGVSPPFTVCARSWFEVWGSVWASEGGGVGWGE